MESRSIATNKKAFRDFFLLEKWECGIQLKGGEVKSLRSAEVNFTDSFARVEGDEVFLYNARISPYEEASYLNVEPTRLRKLLLHRNQIRKLTGQLTQKGLTLIPLKVYFNERGFVKTEIAICKGKKLYDKREDIKKREINLEMRRAMKSRRK